MSGIPLPAPNLLFLLLSWLKVKMRQKTTPQYSDRGKTVSLILCLTKNIHDTGNIVVLDSGFCVLQIMMDIKIGQSMEPLLSIIGGTVHDVSMVIISRLTSMIIIWLAWMNRTVILTICLFRLLL